LVKLLFENVKYSETKREFEFQQDNLERSMKDVIEWLRDSSPNKALSKSDSVKSNLSEREIISNKCLFRPRTSDVKFWKPISTSYLQNGVELSI